MDRRVPCQALSDCPHGYACRFWSPDQRYCRRITQPCELGSFTDCVALGVFCGDVDGDGQGECMPSLTPNDPGAVACENSQCGGASTPVCEATVDGTRSVCGQFGLCQTALDCAAGFECRDLWGDGRSECVETGGSCTDTSNCGVREVCASPRVGGAPACEAGSAM